MAYSDYGAIVRMNGKRRRDKEDVGVYDTDEENLPSGLRIWANIVKNREAGRGERWRHSHHGVMGDGKVRCACYKQGFPTIYVWDDGAEEPRVITEEEIIAHNGWTTEEPWIGTWSFGERKGEPYIDAFDNGFIAFTVPGLDGYEFTHESCGKPRESTMREPDGTYWTCEHDYWYGAGFEEW